MTSTQGGLGMNQAMPANTSLQGGMSQQAQYAMGNMQNMMMSSAMGTFNSTPSSMNGNSNPDDEAYPRTLYITLLLLF